MPQGSHELIGRDWHQSFEKRVFDAKVAAALRTRVFFIVSAGAKCLNNLYGYQIGTSRRTNGSEEFEMLKMQTMYSLDVPWNPGVQNKIPILPHAWLARLLMIDELIQLAHVSTDPHKPGPLSLVGPRSLVPGEVAHMKEVAREHNASDMYDLWLPRWTEMPKGVIDIASDLPGKYPQGSWGLYEERMKRHLWLYNNASQSLDAGLFSMLAIAGIDRINNAPQLAKEQMEIWEAYFANPWPLPQPEV